MAGRRTQAQRREATRGALLDAALGVLVDDGPVALTTRRVADRAGVSQGAVMHHFGSRPELIGAIVRHASAQLVTEIAAAGELAGPTREPRRFAALLDRLWDVHNGPVFQAVMELWMSARRDAGVAEAIREAARDVDAGAAAAALDFYPGIAADPRAQALLDEIIVLARGCAYDTLVGDRALADRRWAVARAALITRFLSLDGDPWVAVGATG